MKTIVFVFLYMIICSVQIYSISADELNLNAKAAVIMDAESGKILYGKSKDQKMPNASTTKILTCLYILEHCDIEKKAKVSKNAAIQPKVRLGVREGESYKVKDLLYGLMLEIQGWTTDQRGNVEVTVHKENTELLDCKITRGRRPDVVERRHLDDDYKNQEIGFSISAAFLEIPGNWRYRYCVYF